MAKRKDVKLDSVDKKGWFSVGGNLGSTFENGEVVGYDAEVVICLTLDQRKLLDTLASRKKKSPLGLLQERIEKDILNFLPIKK
ncbi:MAG: hypothetical protein Q8L24_00025 [bacterium]|nr:hypothetical protein [bacterium]